MEAVKRHPVLIVNVLVPWDYWAHTLYNIDIKQRKEPLYANNEGPGQIRAFAVLLNGHLKLNTILTNRDKQAGLGLHCSHMARGPFSSVKHYIKIDIRLRAWVKEKETPYFRYVRSKPSTINLANTQ